MEVNGNLHLVDKPDSTRYELIIGWGFQQGTGMYIINDALSFK